MSAAVERPREFHCPRWPGCACPDGTVALDCPGRTTGNEVEPDEAMAREQAAVIALATKARRGRTISGESLIADINTLLIRCERGLAELNAVHTELTMIRNDMAELHGLPRD